MRDATKVILIVWIYLASRLATLHQMYWEQPMGAMAFEYLGIIFTFIATVAYIMFTKNHHKS